MDKFNDKTFDLKEFDRRVATLKQKLIALATARDSRIETGLERREAMAAKLDTGGEPGYRYDFLVDSANRLIKELAVIAREFNDKYPDDCCTNYDFLDILNTTIASIKRASKK